MPDSDRKTMAESASDWMQVTFGGLSVTIAIVALVIGYFAWVQPHSPDDNSGTAAPRATSQATPPPPTT